MPKNSISNAIENLLFYKIIKKENKVIKLNLENEETQDLMKLVDNERKRLNFLSYEIHIALIVFLSKLEEYNDINEVYLFGSHAKKTASKNSDIDIAIITDNVNMNLTKVQIELEDKYGYKFQFVTLKKLGNDALSLEIKKHGVRLV